VATDHAPHALPEKQGSDFEHAAFGFSGLEFALPTMLALVRAGHLSLSDVIYRLSTVPARFLRANGGALTPNFPADIVIFDPNAPWIADASKLKSKSANTPLLGMELKGKVVRTFVDGEVKFDG